MTDYLTYFGTAANKQPKQLIGRINQMAKSRILPRLPIDIDACYQSQIPSDITVNSTPLCVNTIRLRDASSSERKQYKQRAEKTLNGTLPFLNNPVKFSDGSKIRLNSSRVTNQPIHWRIKCFGFEHIKWVWLGYENPDSVPEEALSIHREWLCEWIERHEIAQQNDYLRQDWTPHAVSLRICNWCRYDAWIGDRLDEEYKQTIRRFVWKNTAFLSNNVEHGVGGNHLIENAIALLISGVHLDNSSWVKQGHKILRKAVDDQLLSDGGHFERSPMYHLIICQRLLTAIDLLDAIGDGCVRTKKKTQEAVFFVEKLCPPDERIPLLNDSVFGEALPLSSFLAYAKSIADEFEQRSLQNSQDKNLMPKTGYYWLGESEDRLLAIGGDITVPHLPAHAHAHPAQICLWVGGEHVITDTGVYEYAAGKRRHQSRSVQGHNTVQIDQREPFRFSGEFLGWGEIKPNVTYSNNHERTELDIEYSVDAVGQPAYRHERQIVHQKNQWIIRDHVEGVKEVAVNRLHIHPDFEVTLDDDQATICDSEGTSILNLKSYECESVSVTTSPYYPNYGREFDRDVIEFRRIDEGEFGVNISLSE
jgi:uncharacterized heparinase superfamily protein